MTYYESIKRARAKYMREYRKRNPEKIKEYNDRYWLKKSLELDLEDEGDRQNEKSSYSKAV